MSKALFTIGHGRRSWLEFVALLDENAIDVVLDVRWKPASRWCPWSNRALESTLGARYVFDGSRLGNPAHFGDVPIAAPDRRVGLEDLERRIEFGERVALFCSERSPLGCHRRELARSVAIDDIQVVDLA